MFRSVFESPVVSKSTLPSIEAVRAKRCSLWGWRRCSGPFRGCMPVEHPLGAQLGAQFLFVEEEDPRGMSLKGHIEM